MASETVEQARTERFTLAIVKTGVNYSVTIHDVSAPKYVTWLGVVSEEEAAWLTGLVGRDVGEIVSEAVALESKPDVMALTAANEDADRLAAALEALQIEHHDSMVSGMAPGFHEDDYVSCPERHCTESRKALEAHKARRP